MLVLLYLAVVKILSIVLSFALALPAYAVDPAAATGAPVDPAGAAQGDSQPIAIFQYSAHPSDARSPLREVNVAATEISDPDLAPSAVEAVLAGRNPDAVSEIVPDDSHVGNAAVSATADSLLEKTSAKLKQKIKVPARQLADWFKKSRFRLSIIAVEVTTITSLKYLELIYSPQPVEHSVAFTCGILMGALMGTIEWNTPRVIKLLSTTSTPVKEVMNRIIRMANAAESGKLQTTLTTVWQFFKNSSLNFLIFSVFKMILFATTQDANSAADVALNAIHAMTPHNLGDSTRLALSATAVSFPTTKVIIAYVARAQKQANGDGKKLLRVKDMMTLMISSALTARALFFSSMMIAATFDWPKLKFAAVGGLATMFVGSIWKLLDNAHRDRRERCEAALAVGDEI